MKPRFLIAASLFALTGCIAQSRIQAKYMDQESTCRNEAADHANDPPPLLAPGVTRTDNNTPVFAAFSACMNKAGWKVSVPKTATAAATPPATLPPSGAPGPGGTVAAVRAPAATTAPVASQPLPPAGKANAAPILGPGVQPDPAPASAVVPRPAAVAPAPVAPAYIPDTPATYQPVGRPGGAATPDYGSGAGRNF